jgi:hypothetical protein
MDKAREEEWKLRDYRPDFRYSAFDTHFNKSAIRKLGENSVLRERR